MERGGNIQRLEERIKEIELQTHLKSLILHQLRFIYGPRYPPGSSINIIMSRIARPDRERDGIAATAIILTSPSTSAHWKLLKKGKGPQGGGPKVGWPNAVAALQELLMETEREVAAITAKMKPGDEYGEQRGVSDSLI
ncbi:hypothetical protein K505DRAFT_355285 [Melanomma pulvis-pyrius CBS 109.77]|uniref:Uncharacterized protein n=1 Tax=Melanomma pulvis-pyrius CBS 109.77 TaxID=1314802 RepID=A0A6A6XWX0_9PLEO|nr:hypothetical protein K505DRAFT_355285 [Melanomma pulvis-pyrius CBS 109.77]